MTAAAVTACCASSNPVAKLAGPSHRCDRPIASGWLLLRPVCISRSRAIAAASSVDPSRTSPRTAPSRRSNSDPGKARAALASSARATSSHDWVPAARARRGLQDEVRAAEIAAQAAAAVGQVGAQAGARGTGPRGSP